MTFKWAMIGVYLLLGAAAVGLPPHRTLDYVLAAVYMTICAFLYFQIWREERGTLRGGRIDDTVIGSEHDD